MCRLPVALLIQSLVIRGGTNTKFYSCQYSRARLHTNIINYAKQAFVKLMGEIQYLMLVLIYTLKILGHS